MLNAFEQIMWCTLSGKDKTDEGQRRNAIANLQHRYNTERDWLEDYQSDAEKYQKQLDQYMSGVLKEIKMFWSPGRPPNDWVCWKQALWLSQRLEESKEAVKITKEEIAKIKEEAESKYGVRYLESEYRRIRKAREYEILCQIK